ncbi:MAG: iron-siderophore ABC transporter substrate-binding protein [Leptolyngbya sp. SIO4C5]|nr:iron-siderophore ABC transporter substrate-binding protein [Leptolyngbya sp. SIO4C5]
MARWLVLSVVIAAVIIGCDLSADDNFGDRRLIESEAQAPAVDCRTVQHDLGETEICGQPQQVATLSAYTLELLLALDQQPAGYSPSLNTYFGEVFDNPAQQIPYLGDRVTTQPMNLGTANQPSLEKLVALKPDLIVAEGNRGASTYGLLFQIAPTLVWQARGAKGQWQQNLQTLAMALGNTEKADTVIQQHETRIAAARAEFADVVKEHPKLLVLAGHRLDQGIRVFDADNSLGELLTEIGFQFVPESSSRLNADGPISVEALPQFNDADIIIILGYDLSAGDQEQANANQSANESASERVEQNQVQIIKQNWEASEVAQSLTASQEDRVYFATFYKWFGLNGPIGAELILEDLREFLLE